MQPRIPEWMKKTSDAILEARCVRCNSPLEAIEGGYKCSNCGWQVVAKNPHVSKWNKFVVKLNNNKSIIGGGLVAIGFLSSLILQPLGQGIKWIGYTVLGSGAVTAIGGVGHKIFKANNKVKLENGGEKKWWEILLLILSEIIKQLQKRR